ncbi:MAG TPA: class I SAM-dependent methyltransferase, partial [Methanocella sp.]|nr:class I SAM-dependent methyltransferase [Methanocella sp.]
MMSLDWKTLWNESQRGSFMEKGAPEDGKWLEFWNQEAGQYLDRVRRDEAFYQEIVGYLSREMAFRRGDRVLDIACGPGTYTLQFAPEAASVTALDFSSGMLSTLMAEAGRRGLGNIRPLQSTWSQFIKADLFDLVFTALSPAVRGPDDLLKMEEYSTRTCCYITFGAEEQSRIRNDLWNILAGKGPDKKDFNVSYPFNLLISMGRKPNVRFFDHVSQESMTVDQLTEYHAKFFGNFLQMDDEKRDKIRE